LRINSQVQAADSYRKYSVNNGGDIKKAEGSGSAQRVGGSVHDAMGRFISGRMRALNLGLSETSKMAQVNVSQIQSAEVTLQKADNTLIRMREMAAMSADAATSNADRIVLDHEFTHFKLELNRLGSVVPNGVEYTRSEKPMIDREPVGVSTGDVVRAAIEAINVKGLSDIRSAESAKSAVSAIGDVMDGIAAARAKLGESQARLISEDHSAGGSAEIRQGSAGRISDASSAKKMLEKIRSDMLSKPSQSTVAQANAIPQAVLQLLS